MPGWEFEDAANVQGHQVIAGVDEVGMGCLAGPVVAGAVVLPRLFSMTCELNDSKKVSEKKRKIISEQLKLEKVPFALGMASVEEIDSLNIYQAARLAMRRAVEMLPLRPDFLLIDGRAKVELPIPQVSIIKGDQKSVSIAAASILAKVYRDTLMLEMDAKYPGYYFANNKGYGSVLHRKGLMAQGRSEIHRTSSSWKPV